MQVVAWRGKKENTIQQKSNILIYAFPACNGGATIAFTSRGVKV